MHPPEDTIKLLKYFLINWVIIIKLGTNNNNQYLKLRFRVRKNQQVIRKWKITVAKNIKLTKEGEKLRTSKLK